MKLVIEYPLIYATGFQFYKMDANTIVREKMYANDAFSQWLGIDVIEAGPGYCSLLMTVRKEMTNGFGIAHGGITYSLADSALAFASNGQGHHALSVETSISHIKTVAIGDQLKANAKEVAGSRRIGHYEVSIYNQDNIMVAWFKGIVYKKEETWK